MEYLISNRHFNESKQFGEVFYSGDFSVHENSLIMIEGDVVGNSNDLLLEWNVDDFIAANFLGTFNYLNYCNKTKSIQIKNDKAAYLPLYIYTYSNLFVISNSFWLIIKNLNEDEIIIDDIALKEYIYYNTIPNESKTYFKNIIQLGAAKKLYIDIRENIIKEKTYWELVQTKSKKTIHNVVDEFDNGMHDFFSFVSNKYSHLQFGYGNSGGLDSRLFPLYAQDYNISLVGYTISNVKPNKILYSVTNKNAQDIANLFNISTKHINYKTNGLENRMQLDVRNNPFGTCEIFKNPVDKLPTFGAMFSGGSGFIVGHEMDLSLLEYIDNSISLENYFIKSTYRYTGTGKNILRKVKKYLSNDNSSASEINRKVELPNYDLFFELFNRNEIEEMHDDIRQYVRSNLNVDNISAFRNYKLKVLNKTSPQGGFESMTRLKKSFSSYYPFLLEKSINWPIDHLSNRKVLKELIYRKSSQLASIPDQKQKKINASKGSLLNLLEFGIRGWGLDYQNWVKQNNYIDFSNKIMYRPNPLFEKHLNLSLIQKMKYVEQSPEVGLEILKLKKILDIIYYKEFGFIDNEDFKIEQ